MLHCVHVRNIEIINLWLTVTLEQIGYVAGGFVGCDVRGKDVVRTFGESARERTI